MCKIITKKMPLIGGAVKEYRNVGRKKEGFCRKEWGIRILKLLEKRRVNRFVA